MSEERNTGINVQAPKLIVRGEAVVRRPDGTIKATMTLDGAAVVQPTSEDTDHGSDTSGCVEASSG